MTDLYNMDRILVTLLYNTKRFYGTKEEQVFSEHIEMKENLSSGKELLAIWIMEDYGKCSPLNITNSNTTVSTKRPVILSPITSVYNESTIYLT